MADTHSYSYQYGPNFTQQHPSDSNFTVSTINLTITEMDNSSSVQSSPFMQPASIGTIVILSVLFCVIGLLGVVGNSLVIAVILIDRKMRQSVTNIFIMNLAIADLIIMIFGIPEIIQFMLNRGWLLGVASCKLNRYVLVACLYVSVLSLVSVCIERFVAIVFPIKAQILCNRRKNFVVVSLIWSLGLICGLPTALYNQVQLSIPQHDISFCMPAFPAQYGHNIYKFSEFAFFYFIPVCIQIILYAIIGKKLYVSTSELHTKFQMRNDSNCRTDRAADTIKARKGVVKMLVASVVVYTVCYAPPQVLLVYNVISNDPFRQSWPFIAFVNIIAYINSAANPILYSIFSQNFRKNFKKCLKCICLRPRKDYLPVMFDSSADSRLLSRKISQKTTISRL